MKQFTIIAGREENPNKKPWWKFWEQEAEEEVAENSEFRAIIKYVNPQNYNFKLSSSVIFSDNLLEFSNQSNLSQSINRNISLKILPEIIKSKGFGDTRNCAICFTDNEFDTNYLLNLVENFKSVTIISQNCPSYIVDKIFEQTGYIIEIKKEITNCDLIFDNSGNITDYNDKKRYKVEINYDLNLAIPIKIDSLRLIKSLLNSNIIPLSECIIKFEK